MQAKNQYTKTQTGNIGYVDCDYFAQSYKHYCDERAVRACLIFTLYDKT